MQTNLVLWLHFNKLRNRHKRIQIEKQLDEKLMLSIVPKFGINVFNETYNERMVVVQQNAKKTHIKSLTDTELLYRFDKHMGEEHKAKTPKRKQLKIVK